MAVPHQSTSLSRPGRQPKRRQQSRLASLFLILAGVGLLAAVLLVFNQNSANPVIWRVSLGKEMPDLALKDLSGKTVHMSDYAGRPIFINAWATWCPPCRQEMPLLEAYYLDHRDEGLVFLAINAGEDKEIVSQFITQSGFDFPVLLDPDADTLLRLGVDSFPTSILVGKDGNVQAVHIGLLTDEALNAEFTPFLKR